MVAVFCGRTILAGEIVLMGACTPVQYGQGRAGTLGRVWAVVCMGFTKVLLRLSCVVADFVVLWWLSAFWPGQGQFGRSYLSR